MVMITGDHAITARSVGRTAGLDGNVANVIEGQHLVEMMENNCGDLLGASIFARVSPTEKLPAYQAVGDASALRQADIGVAMGFRDADVGREVAAMLLFDDAFPLVVTQIVIVGAEPARASC
ncbi:hypothetical protein ACKWRH_45820 (plasmid) [Bradyrhizobium sp. Pa8]|uniref:hypothetical protein n=1 Tax=Bradyrhizobium sp. Pa8 TaxID=3386552 RepID=UPI00403FB088